MLQATIVNPGGELSVLSGSNTVSQLQTALKCLAVASKNSKIDPGSTSGEVDSSTINAVGNAIAIVKKYAPGKVPSQVWTALQNIGLITGVASYIPGGSAITNAIKSAINSYAGYLATGASTAAAAMGGCPGVPGGGGSGAAASTYRAGSVQAQDPTTKQWIIASPRLSGGLGTSPEGEQYEIVDKQGNKAALTVIPYDQLKKWMQPPWYKSLWFWGGAVAVLGVGYGSYRMIKRRRA